MKARKVLAQQLLIAEVVSQARAHFTAPVALIKKCIVQLIEKDFLEVDDNDDNQDTTDDTNTILKYI